jgi:4-carboxymuconolactone decarboxylase
MPKEFLEMWFGKGLNKDGLDAKTRLLITLAGLTMLGAQSDTQIRMTVRHALEAGATRRTRWPKPSRRCRCSPVSRP